eukprot:ANDGO_07611.mRNA.1 hypothetical protein
MRAGSVFGRGWGWRVILFFSAFVSRSAVRYVRSDEASVMLSVPKFEEDADGSSSSDSGSGSQRSNNRTNGREEVANPRTATTSLPPPLGNPLAFQNPVAKRITVPPPPLSTPLSNFRLKPIQDRDFAAKGGRSDRLPNEEYKSAFRSGVRRSVLAFCVFALILFCISIVFYMDAHQYMDKFDMHISGDLTAARIRAIDSLCIGSAASSSAAVAQSTCAMQFFSSDSTSTAFSNAPFVFSGPTFTVNSPSFFLNTTTFQRLNISAGGSVVVSGLFSAFQSNWSAEAHVRNVFRVEVGHTVDVLGGNVSIADTSRIASMSITDRIALESSTSSSSSYSSSSGFIGNGLFTDIDVLHQAELVRATCISALNISSFAGTLATQQMLLSGKTVFSGNLTLRGPVRFLANETVFDGPAIVKLSASSLSSRPSFEITDVLAVYRQQIIFESPVSFSGTTVFQRSVDFNVVINATRDIMFSGGSVHRLNINGYGDWSVSATSLLQVFSDWRASGQSLFLQSLWVGKNAQIGDSSSLSGFGMSVNNSMFFEGGGEFEKAVSVSGGSECQGVFQTAAPAVMNVSSAAGALLYASNVFKERSELQGYSSISNLSISGYLSVTGYTSSFESAVRVEAPLLINVLDVNQYLAVLSNLSVYGATVGNQMNISRTFELLGSAIFRSSSNFGTNLTVGSNPMSLYQNFSVAGGTTVRGSAVCSPPLVILGTLSVSASAVLADTVYVFGSSFIADSAVFSASLFSNLSLSVSVNMSVASSVSVDRFLLVSGSSTVLGVTSVNSSVSVKGTSVFANRVIIGTNSVASGGAEFSSALYLANNASFAANVSCAGNASFAGSFAANGTVNFWNGIQIAGSPAHVEVGHIDAGLQISKDLFVTMNSSFLGGSGWGATFFKGAYVNHSLFVSPFLNVSGYSMLDSFSVFAAVTITNEVYANHTTNFGGIVDFRATAFLTASGPWTVGSQEFRWSNDSTMSGPVFFDGGLTTAVGSLSNFSSSVNIWGSSMFVGGGNIVVDADTTVYGNLTVSPSAMFSISDASKQTTFRAATSLSSAVSLTGSSLTFNGPVLLAGASTLNGAVTASSASVASFSGSVGMSASVTILSSSSSLLVNGPLVLTSPAGVVFEDLVQFSQNATMESTAALQGALNTFSSDVSVGGSMSFSGSVGNLKVVTFSGNFNLRSVIFQNDDFSAYAQFETPRVDTPYEIQIYDGSPLSVVKLCRLGCLYVDLLDTTFTPSCLLYIDEVAGCRSP